MHSSSVGKQERLAVLVKRSDPLFGLAGILIVVITLLLPAAAGAQDVQRGWLGVAIAENNPATRRKFGLKTAAGVVVSSVTRGSPAERAGLKEGDIITRVGNASVSRPRQLAQEISLLMPGQKVRFQVMTDNKVRTATATLGKHPAERALAQGSRRAPANVGAGPDTPGTSGQFFERESEGVELVGIEAGPTQRSSRRPDCK